MVRSLLQRLAAGLAVALAIGGLLSAIAPPSVKFTDSKLPNGLRLIVAEDHSAPVFSVAVIYNVGSRNERPGRTGFAHLFEHMMFKGLENVGPGEHFYTIFSNGGTMNGTTDNLSAASTQDVASFFQTYYAPNNAILAVAGDVTVAKAQELARKYFQSIPGQPAPPPVDISQSPQNGERRLNLDDALARLPRL